MPQKSGERDFTADNIRINVMCLKGEIPSDVCQTYSHAKASMQRDVMLAIQEEYLYNQPEETSPPKKTEKTPESHKAGTTYKKLQRMLRYQTLKEEVLLEHNHSCECCGKEYPPRSEWKEMYPGTSYPLLVRFTLPIVKYIQVNNLFDIKKLTADAKIFDPQKYSVLCEECKPPAFRK